MLNRLIDFSLHHRALVIGFALVLAVAGGVSVTQIDIDAFPDTTPVQIQVNTTAPSLGPQEIEQQITFPIEQVLGGMPRLTGMRSLSKFGLSQVTVTFTDGTDIYFARQVISERLGTVELPPGIERPKMGPVSTGLGEVFHYIVRSTEDLSRLSEADRVRKLTELRTVHDWIIRPQLRTVAGTAEVNTWGGYAKQYQVRIDPQRLIKHGLTFDQVVTAVEQNNANIGGGNITTGSQMLLVHGVGRAENIDHLRTIVVTAKDGVPIRVQDVADVEIGHETRQGAVTADGRGEAVLGLGFLLMGENTHAVTQRMKRKLDDIRETLPPGVAVETVYDRTELVEYVIDTVRKNLFEGGLLVIAVLFLFLGNVRASLIVALAIPLSMLCAFSGMLQVGISASLLSLGAVDFGMVVDSSVVMVENCIRHIAHGDVKQRTKLEVIRDAAVEVRKPTLFGELIIMIVYLPILTLEGIEGKLFRPMALTVIFAIAGSMILSMTLMPVLASLLLPRRIEEREPLLMRLAHRVHNPVLWLCMKFKAAVLGIAAIVLIVAFGMIAPNLGAEFLPKLSEGSFVIGVRRLPGTDLAESIRSNTLIEQRLLAAFPDEIRNIWSRIGTAEVATDPMGVELTDVFIGLHPRSRWTKGTNQADLIAAMEHEMRDAPGIELEFMQPIEHRMMEFISGSRLDVAVKVFADDLDALAKTSAEIGAVLQQVPGAADVYVPPIAGQPILQVKIDRDQIARHGLPASQVLEVLESLGSKPLGELIEGQLRFPLVVRLPEQYRTDAETVGRIPISTPTGGQLPLSRLASVNLTSGPTTINREWGQRRITISCNVRGRDLVSFVEEARRRIAAEVTLPGGRSRVEYGGMFEHYESARHRLFIVVPLAVLAIFALLYITYNNVWDSVRVLTGVPLGWVGGIFALWLRDLPFSISAAIGFIAMSGVAVLDDMILVSYIRQLRRSGLLRDAAVRQAAVTRLRPVLMTTLVASLGFLPMALSTDTGAEVQRPLATVVIGGVISAMLMSLLVIRVLYVAFDAAAQIGEWLLGKLFGWTPDQLRWLFGESYPQDHPGSAGTHPPREDGPRELDHAPAEHLSV
jgi:cobalt-zinc-cadmium resistance protein CzcA